MSDQLPIDFTKPLHSPVHNLDLQPHERRVLELIRTGRENARQSRVIAELIGEGEVTTRRIVKHLVEHHNILIVSSTTKPAGYYFPVDMEEQRAGAQQIINRIRSLRARLDEMDREAAEKIFGQRNYLDDLEAS
jgi:hypothetical protein